MEFMIEMDAGECRVRYKMDNGAIDDFEVFGPDDEPITLTVSEHAIVRDAIWQHHDWAD